LISLGLDKLNSSRNETLQHIIHSMSKKTIHLIAGARPNFMKIAPLFHALDSEEWAKPIIVHTGQHYDYNMSDAFFEDLGLPEPGYHLGVGSGGHGEQTGTVMIQYEKVCTDYRPDWVVVVGDVNSTIAAALVATKLGIPVSHLEAGLRSNDRTMPEEINRLATDAIADKLWTPSHDADTNLINEGVQKERIACIGNIMIDSFVMMKNKIDASNERENLGVDKKKYAVVTLHRPSNVDDEKTLSELVNIFVDVSNDIYLLFFCHPRTVKNLKKYQLLKKLKECKNIQLEEPMPYVKFMNVVSAAVMVITDSGGLQEETTFMHIPCLTLRPNTERPITMTEGTNELVTQENLSEQVAKALEGNWKKGKNIELWDGKAALRAVECLKADMNIR